MLFLSKIISLPSKTPKTGSFLRILLQHNGRVLTCCELYQCSSLVQVRIFFNQVLCCCYRKQIVCCTYKLAPSMLFQSKIISLPLKTLKTGSFLRRLCSTMVEYRLPMQVVRVQALPKSGFFFQFGVFLLLQETKGLL